MEMKLEEAQICRLCGECESIYIDVFGEEGTKRFLGVKIHTKINILIDEADPLPKAICVQCLGKLEFVCDFQEECLRTQQVLRERYNLPPLTDVINETDGLSHKVCVKCLGALEFLCDFHDQCHKTQKKLSEAKESRERDKISEATEPSYDSDKENVSPVVKHMIKRKKRPDSANHERSAKPAHAMPDKCLKVNIRESERSQAEMKLNESEETEARRVEGMKIQQMDKINEAEVDDSNDSLSKGDRKVGDTDGEKTSSQAIVAIVKLEKNENTSPLPNPTLERPLKCNKIVWIPNMLQLPEGDSPRSVSMEKSHDDSPPAGDEAEKHGSSCGDRDKSVQSEKEVAATATMEVARRRRSVIEKPGKASRERALRVTRKKIKIDEREEEEEEDEEEYADDTDDVDSGASKRFSKITDLITEEQKAAIEKFYVCDMSVVDERIVGEHLVCLDRKKFGCKLCKASYARQDKCQVHIWGHLAMKPYRCNACDFSTVTVSNIRCHIRKSHLKIKPYVCEYCEKRYVTAFLLDEHMNTHTGSRPYTCDVCNFTSASRQVLSYHKTTHKPSKDITCNVCGKEFYSKGRLRAHMIVHDKDKAANMCKLCSIYLCNREALQRHHANVHSKDYECDVCGKRCKSKKALNNHSNVHSAAKYKCNLCSNVYKSSHILKEHLLKHEGIRKYKCNVCRKDFAQQSHLAAHMAVHSDRRFFCPGCKRPFNRHDNMKMHTRRCEAFLANPELASMLSARRCRNEGFTNSTKKSVASPSTETRFIKTDFHKKENTERENSTTIIVESTIPCT